MVAMTLNSLPLGFRFRPTDEELVDYYLRNKINGNDSVVKVIREIDVCKWEPWDLPDLSVVQSNDLEWFFFCPRDQKYPSGPRLNRATEAGYWKATGKDRKIKNRASEIGMKKTLVFHKGRAPKGKRTNWVMHEYRTTLGELDGTRPGQSAFVLCRLFKKLDESVENSLCEEVEPPLSSPTAINSSPGYPESEIALDDDNPVLELQVQNLPTKTESFQPEDSERRSTNIGIARECYNRVDSSYDSQVHAPEVMENEVNPPKMDYWTFDANLGTEDCKLISPLSAQMQAGQGSSDMQYLFSNDLSNSHNGMPFQNEQDISNFLNSILNDSEDEFCYGDLEIQKPLEMETTKYINNLSSYNDCIERSGSYSESDPELAQLQLDMEFGPTYHFPGTVDREVPVKIESTPGTFTSDTSDYCFDFNLDTCFLPFEQSLVTQPDNVPFKESITQANAVDIGESGTGIRIRTRQPRDYSTSNDFSLPQGFAPRRNRMQTKLEIGSLNYCKADFFFKTEDIEKSTVAEEEKSAENHVDDKATIFEDHQKLPPSKPDQDKSTTIKKKLMFKSIIYEQGGKINPFGFAKIGVRRSILSPVSMLRRAIIAVVFCVVLAGLWSFMEYQYSLLKFVSVS